MADDSINKGRRRFLTASTAAIGGAGLIITAIPFVETWLPSARAEAAGSPITVDIGKIEKGQMVRYGWRKQPIFVINRTPEQLQWLPKQDPRLRDPDSNASEQPAYCKNGHRSIKPEWMVLIGICTHLGCVPDYKKKVGPEPFDPDWKGGFYCPCHHSRYDMAARVYDGVPAPLNMVVPPYHFVDDTHIQVGVDPKGAA
ncbi:MAG TPA: ubiquinol-cytochrome c reductase iron-sulfur subunit [Rhodanobacteraceae bacterium]|nr:ubiquinol-cytochrome c reductase iron-sulfur subunit [Rhodanobacteraceae bacterium]